MRGASVILAAAVGGALPLGGCRPSTSGSPEPDVPRGYVASLAIDHGGRRLRFGPFVGYRFRPEEPGNPARLRFLCFNEDRFYASDLPAGAKLFEGTAVLATLPRIESALPGGAGRIRPVFFPDAPPEWLETRPEPRDEYLHFHSCHDAEGATWTGYWLRHVAVASFTYDMGGRVGEESPLHHRVTPGADRGFARIVEFDHGPR